ncbi:MAG: dienelactone hydrolase family protein [Balneolaceae bacterium]
MFRATKEDRFEGPHQKSKIVYAGVDIKDANGAMIMIHGRGATAESIITLADEFDADDLHLVAPQANQFQWYPYSFLAPTERNEPGLSSGLQAIYDIVTELVENGISKEKIILLGFSQGACLATEFVARHPAKYGGLAALSGGVIGDEVSTENYSGSLKGTPAFLGCSNIDPHIPKERVDESEKILKNLGAEVTKKIYKGMGHTVNEDEIAEVSRMIQRVNA